MEEMWREITERVSSAEWVRRRLCWEDWRSLIPEAVRLARRELRRHYWRGDRRGVLPRGYDAEAIASEAILELLEGKCRLAPGWTRERLVAEIERLISRKVRLLNSLKETTAMRNEWDLKPPKSNGEAVSALRNVPGDGQNGYETAVEEEEGDESRRETIEKQLEPELRAVFRCIWEGRTLTREIANRLGVTEHAALLARRRLARRLKRIRGNS